MTIAATLANILAPTIMPKEMKKLSNKVFQNVVIIHQSRTEIALGSSAIHIYDAGGNLIAKSGAVSDSRTTLPLAVTAKLQAAKLNKKLTCH